MNAAAIGSDVSYAARFLVTVEASDLVSYDDTLVVVNGCDFAACVLVSLSK